LDKRSEQEMQELFYAVLLATIMLGLHEKTAYWAQDYAGQTVAFGNFDYFRSSATDLYVLAYYVFGDHSSLMQTDQAKFLQVMRGMARGHVTISTMNAFVLKIERRLAISNSVLKGVRRDVLAWGSLNQSQQQSAAKQLTRIIRRHSAQAEVIPYLGIVAKGTPGTFGKTKSLGKAIATIAGAGLAGLALGLRYDPNKKWSLFNSYEVDEVPLEESWDTEFDALVEELKEQAVVQDVVSVSYVREGISAFIRATDGEIYELDIRSKV